MDWDTILGIHQMSLWVPHSAFWDWQVDFGLPSLKYSYTLHAKFDVSKPVIIIDSCVVKSWFTITNVQCLSNCQGQNDFISYCILYMNDQFYHTYLHIEAT